MKNSLKAFLFLLFLCSGGWSFGQPIGNVEKLQMHSDILNQEREILVYTPPYYEESAYQYFDVIFVFDSQNREFFDLTHSLISFIDEDFTDKPFIIVGIASYTGKEAYARADDFLPVPRYDNVNDNLYGFGHANQIGFTHYLQNEVLPLLEKEYRITSRRLAIGHSLGGSYVLSTLVNTPTLFTDYMAVSPNFAYDKERLANGLVNLPYEELSEDKFLYLSHANERWRGWKEAREKVYEFLNSSKPSQLKFEIQGFEDKGHRVSFLPALQQGLKAYVSYRNALPIEKHKVEITVQVPNEADEVFITGNQEVLGNWQEGRIKMKRISPLERRISLLLDPKTEIRFTNGNAKSNQVADIEDYDLPWLFHIPISAAYTPKLGFKILGWTENSFD